MENFKEEYSNSYSVKIDVFEGPLDLLLHLIKDAKLDIQTIKLSEITGQYLDYINSMDLLNLENAADFLEVAATLIEIKSKKDNLIINNYLKNLSPASPSELEILIKKDIDAIY